MAKTPALEADGKVEFESPESLRESYDTFLSQGGVLVRPERPLGAFAAVELTLVSPSSPETLAVKAQACATSDAGVFLRFVEFNDALKSALKAFAERPPAKSSGGDETPEPAHAKAVTLAATGRFKNPALPQDFLALPLVRAPTPEQVASPPMPLVLQVLACRTEPCTRLVARAGGNKHVELFSTPGGPVSLGVPAKAAVAALAEQNGSYELSSVAAPRLHYSVPMGGLQCAVVKELVKRYVEPDLRAAMAGRMGQSPKLGPTGARMLKRFSLSEAQHRVAMRMLTGTYALDEVLYTGIGVRSTFQVLYLLEATGALEWADPPPKSSVLLDELKATLERVRGADHFMTLGLYLSTPPRLIDRTFSRLRETYGPGGVAQRESQQLAAELWARMEKAYAAVSTPAARKAYRKERFPDVRLDYAASLTYDQAMLAELRAEWQQALDLLEISVELNPLGEYAAAYRRVQEKRRAASMR